MTDSQFDVNSFLESLSPSEKQRLTAAVKTVKNWILGRSAKTRQVASNTALASPLSHPIKQNAEPNHSPS